ncbi:hypothetical protein BHE90_014193 [Fusarium euwallaceae]|uniref:Aminoglycoside phosphotransferase domain-containing protein n=1 Tax=Fusarium euwallaceae TaxID=1147111 RepID=A0A430L6P9_9HYPO|nr:hypothetical protein BHE90_014193 [Fusarium euwallaceae]
MALLAVNYDAITYAEGTDAYRTWNKSLTEEHLRGLEPFVSDHVHGRGPAKFTGGISDGSYNRVVRFSFDSDGNDVALKFPKPGHAAAALAQEKIADEAAWMHFLKEETSIPLPHVYSHGTLPDNNPSSLDLPYILMDWVPGDNLREFLKSEPSDELRFRIYRQLASFYLELHRLPLKGIGSVAKDEATGGWAITKRPLTIDMHQFAIGIHEFPTDTWPSGPLESSSDYFDFVSSQHAVQLWNLRNLNALYLEQTESRQLDSSNNFNKISEMARRRYKARYGFAQLTGHFCAADENLGPFRIFNPDLNPRNFLVDPMTGKITGFIDLEFTNAMPAQFSRDPPLWLFKALPEQCLDRGYFLWFLQQYRPLLDQFLDAMKLEEQQMEYQFGETPLSTCMLDSWDTDRVWFDYAATHTDHIDAIYWEVLYKHHPGGIAPEMPDHFKADMERYVQHTKVQLLKYEDAWAGRVRKAG